VTPVYSLYICSALFGDFNKLNDGDDDDDDDVKH